MSDIIIGTIKDFLNSDKELISSRYLGDFEFNRFKKYLSGGREMRLLLFTLVFAVSISIIIYLPFYEVSKLENFYNFISLLLVFLAIFTYSAMTLFDIIFVKYKYLERLDYHHFNFIEWDEWQFKDIIFEEPIELKKNKIITCQIKDEGSIDLILQCPQGHINWSSHEPDNYSLRRFGNDYINSVKHEDLKNKKCKICLNTYELILGIRVRANIFGERAIFFNIGFD